jgi:DNA-binding beta-propeller fold protein YncE
MSHLTPAPALLSVRLRRALLPWMAVAAAAALAGCGATLPIDPIVQIAPETVQLQAGGGTQQFTASVINASNTAVVWKVDGTLGGSSVLGTISQTGLYLPPAVVPSQPVEVEAVSVANAKMQGVATVTLTAGVALTITPKSATVAANGTQQFAATVANASNTAVTWSVNTTVGGNATVGTISPTGLYTAPASFPGLSQVTITAVSVADAAQTATATVTLKQAVKVSVTPLAVNVNVGSTQAFTATVTGASDSVTWSVNQVPGGNATVGTIDGNGVFTAPAQIPSPALEAITATSTADRTQSATAAVTIVGPLTVTVAPLTATLKANATQQFTATVVNARDPSVTWSVKATAGGSSANPGAISATGLYTAPAAVTGPAQVTVTATSNQDPARAGQATVTLQPPVAVTVTPATVTVNLGATQAFAAAVTGSSTTTVHWSVNGVAGGNATLGTIDAGGTFTAPATMPASATETVTATSDADATASSAATVTLQVPPLAFTLSPGSSTLSLGKAQSGTVTLQLALTPGFTHAVTLATSGLPVNVTSTVTPASLTASGAVTVTLTTASISLAQSAVPITVTATSTDNKGAPLTQTATVLLTITGWAGHVATLAGGPGGVGFEDGTGTADELNPTSVTSDGGTNLYFADKRGNALRSYGLGNQTVTTLIGGPYNFTIGEGDGIAFDPDNNTVYVADALRNRIVSFTLGAYRTQVVAGSDVAGHADGVGAAASFDWPHGLAISPDHTTLYVADTDNELIRAVNIASGQVTTLAGQFGSFNDVSPATGFCQPTGLAIAPGGGDLYVTDQCGYVVRQVALPSATVTTVAGNGTTGLSNGPALSASFKALSGVIADPHAGSNLLYVLDGNQIRGVQLGANASVFAVAGGIGPGQADGSAGAASFDNPTGLTAVADAAGAGTTTLFVADTANGLLRRVDVQNPLTAAASGVTLTTSTLAGQPSHRGNSDGVGTGAGYTGASTAEFSQPEGIVTDGKIAYVADSENGAIRKIDLATTSVTTVAGPGQGYADGPASSAAFFQNAGLAWVPSQNVIYIADTGNGAIRKLDLATSTVSTIAGTNAAGYVDGALAAARFNHPYGIVASPDGTKLYVADTGNNAIRLINLTSGTVSTIAGNGGLGSADGVGAAARFAEPNGLAFDSTGNNLYISDFENQAIRELNLTTDAVTTVVGAGHQCGLADGPAASATLCNPAFIATDGRSLFWGDSNTGLLRVLDLATQQVSTLAGAPALLHMANGDFTQAPGELTGPVRYNGVFGIAIAPDESVILFTDKTANVVRIIY